MSFSAIRPDLILFSPNRQHKITMFSKPPSQNDDFQPTVLIKWCWKRAAGGIFFTGVAEFGLILPGVSTCENKMDNDRGVHFKYHFHRGRYFFPEFTGVGDSVWFSINFHRGHEVNLKIHRGTPVATPVTKTGVIFHRGHPGGNFTGALRQGCH